MKALAEEGIRQIRDHRYYTDMEYRGVNQLILFGIAFSGKKVFVKVENR